jgi:hypothetical protein
VNVTRRVGPQGFAGSPTRRSDGLAIVEMFLALLGFPSLCGGHRDSRSKLPEAPARRLGGGDVRRRESAGRACRKRPSRPPRMAPIPAELGERARHRLSRAARALDEAPLRRMRQERDSSRGHRAAPATPAQRSSVYCRR